MLLVAAGFACVFQGSATPVPSARERAQIESVGEAPSIYAILYEPGPNWVPGKPLQGQAGFEGHVRHIQSLGEKGIGAAPLESDAGIAGGLIVMRAGSLEEATRFAQTDPFISGKVMTPRVFRWRVGSLQGCF